VKALKIVGIVIAVLLVILIAVPFFINVNQFRGTIETNLSSSLGREVKVGDLHLSLLTSSVSADNLAIADDAHFSKDPFLTAKSLKVGVELMPLLMSKQVKISSLVIDKPQLTLLRDSSGRWNASTLGTKANKKESGNAAAPDVSIGKLELTNGEMIVGATNSSKRSKYENLQVKATDISAKAQFPLTVTADLPGGGKLKLDGKVGPLDATDASLSPLDAKLKIDGLNLANTGFIDPSAGIAGTMDFDGDVTSRSGMANARGKATLQQLKLVKEGSAATAPVNLDFDTDYDLRRQSGVLKTGAVKVGSAVAKLGGTYDTHGTSPTVNLKIDGKDMPVKDIQAVLPAVGVVLPKGASLEQGTLTGSLNAVGPVDRLVTTGDLGLFNAKLAGFDLGGKMAALQAFTGSKSEGSLTTIDKLTSKIRVAPEGIQASALQLVAPAIGELTGDGTIGSNSSLNMKMLATLTGNSGVAGALGNLTGKASTAARKIPFTIVGTTSDPKFVPDVSGLVNGAIGSQLGGVLGKQSPQTQQGIGNVLGGLFGKKKSK
jgi:AsmA protein